MTGVFYVLLRWHGGGMDTEIRVSTESWPWRRKFSCRSCRDLNPWPFNHESSTLTTELSPPPKKTLAWTGNIRQELRFGMDKDISMDRKHQRQELRFRMDEDISMDRKHQTGNIKDRNWDLEWIKTLARTGHVSSNIYAHNAIILYAQSSYLTLYCPVILKNYN